MFSLSKSARNSLLVILGMLALFSHLTRDSNTEPPPSARIAGEDQIAEEPEAAPKRPDKLIGDHSLRGQLDLQTMELVDNRYQSQLSDGSIAILTLDPKWQMAAESALERAKAPKGAVVVMRKDGTILALSGLSMAGSPLEKQAPELAVQTWAPAASVFKVITASAILEEGVHPKTKLCYHGGLRGVDISNLSDSPRLDGACNTLGYALAKSQNALIAKFSHKHLNPMKLGKMATTFGFGTAPNFALVADDSTLELPSDRLAFAQVAAGFWKSKLSPISGALVANLVASGGMEVSPRIVSEIREKQRVIPVLSAKPVRVLPAKTAKSVAQMMSGTVRFGTGYKGFHDAKGKPLLGEIKVAGKTGSLTQSDPEYLAFSWFVGFSNPDDPDITIAVLLGNAAKWHLKAHTVARLVLQSGLK